MAKILIVDDDVFLVKLLKNRLEKEGFSVIVAHNGREGIEKLIQERPDLMILDIMMPVMDGYTVLINIKEMKEIEENFPSVPVIVLSARSDIKVKKFVQSEDVSAYLLKPFKGEELVKVIKNVLNGEKPC